jgi:hypothetical protein
MGQVWGSHAYYSVAAAVKAKYGEDRGSKRPLAFSRDNGPNWRQDMPSSQGNAVAAHHRHHVWWARDGTSLMSGVKTMVDEGVHDFRPFVHSDCGGHTGGHRGRTGPSGAVLFRWTSRCVFGTTIRFHQVMCTLLTSDNRGQVKQRMRA